MPRFQRWFALLAATVLAAGCASGSREAATAPESPPVQAGDYRVPVFYRTLDNGLKVVVSPDHTAPVVAVAVYFKVGLRTEPKGLTGFSHLFEHLMFEGSENLADGEFDELAQREIVKNEYRLKIENRPYGRFLTVDINEAAFENWQNGHNFWGEMEDLDAATLETVSDFHDTYYAPNNAVVVVVGDVEPEPVFAMAEKHFGGFEPRPQPTPPDLSEPAQNEEKRGVRFDKLAPQPAIAWSYHAPERGTPEHYAMELLGTIFVGGEDSLLWQRIVVEKGYAGFVAGSLNLMGHMFDYDGPMTWTGYLIHDNAVDPEAVVAEIDELTRDLQENLVDQETLDRALLKFRSGFYDTQGSGFGTGRADLLASFALFDDDPGKINTIEDEMRKVTPELIRETARKYMRASNRTLLLLEPGAAAGAGE
jgi:predicted Zn-dependent peptidase